MPNQLIDAVKMQIRPASCRAAWRGGGECSQSSFFDVTGYRKRWFAEAANAP